jgi:VCBS repeat-containing protein
MEYPDNSYRVLKLNTDGSWEYAVVLRNQDVRQLRYIFNNQQRTIVQDRQSMRDVSATFAVTVTSPSPSPLL